MRSESSQLALLREEYSSGGPHNLQKVSEIDLLLFGDAGLESSTLPLAQGRQLKLPSCCSGPGRVNMGGAMTTDRISLGEFETSMLQTKNSN